MLGRLDSAAVQAVIMPCGALEADPPAPTTISRYRLLNLVVRRARCLGEPPAQGEGMTQKLQLRDLRVLASSAFTEEPLLRSAVLVRAGCAVICAPPLEVLLLGDRLVTLRPSGGPRAQLAAGASTGYGMDALLSAQAQVLMERLRPPTEGCDGRLQQSLRQRLAAQSPTEPFSLCALGATLDAADKLLRWRVGRLSEGIALLHKMLLETGGGKDELEDEATELLRCVVKS
jgi:hypothetical protein